MTGSWPLDLFFILCAATVVATTAWHLICRYAENPGSKHQRHAQGEDDNHG